MEIWQPYLAMRAFLEVDLSLLGLRISLVPCEDIRKTTGSGSEHGSRRGCRTRAHATYYGSYELTSTQPSRVNCKAELRVTCYLIGGIQNLLRQKPCEGAKTDSRAKFSKETVAGAHRRPKWVPHYSAQANSGRAQNTQVLLRLCSGLLRLAQACSGSAPVYSPPAQVCSPSAQVKAAVAHVRGLKRN
jgi:hypothetical protein